MNVKTDPLKKSIEKILNELMGHDDGVEFGNGYHDDCKEDINKALAQILEIIDAEKIKELIELATSRPPHHKEPIDRIYDRIKILKGK